MKHKVGISSFAYCFACGTNPVQKPLHYMSPVELIDEAVSIGAEVVQYGDNMPLEQYDDNYLYEIRRHAENAGLELEVGMRTATKERLIMYINIAYKVGAKVLRVVIDGKDFEPEFEGICEILKSVIPELEEKEIILGIENHDRFSSRKFAEIIEQVGNPQIGLTVDTANSLSIEENIDTVIKYMAPYCVCLHMKDYVIVRNNGGNGLKITGSCLGKGRLDVKKYLEQCIKKSTADFNIIIESWMEPCGSIEDSMTREAEWAKVGVKLLKSLLSQIN